MLVFLTCVSGEDVNGFKYINSVQSEIYQIRTKIAFYKIRNLDRNKVDLVIFLNWPHNAQQRNE